MSDMRTPLSRVRGMGSAKDGTQHFWRQRLTAIANLPLMIFFAWLVISLAGSSYGEAKELLSHPCIAILLLALIGSGLFHMKLGMQTVIEDYVHSEGKKMFCLIANIFCVSAIALVSVFSILKLAFGG